MPADLRLSEVQIERLIDAIHGDERVSKESVR